MQSTLKFEQLIYLLASVVRRLNDKPKKAKKKTNYPQSVCHLPMSPN